MIKTLYRKYIHMKDRCYNPNDKRYHRYGGRGIKVCDEWLNNYQSFENWSLQNGYVNGLTIDRINNDGDYEPSNCRYVTFSENSKKKSTTKYFTYNGKTQNLTDWCKELNLKYYTVLCRIRAGWNFEKAILEPVKKGRDKTSMIGKKYGRLTVLKYAGDEYIGSDNNSRYICRCECGNMVIVGQNKLKSGHTQSCGCLRKEKARDYQLNKKRPNSYNKM